MAADFVQELAPQLGVRKCAPPEGGDRARMLLDSPHLSAEMRRLEMHGDAAGRDQLHERVGDLLAEAFLHGEPACEQPDEAGQLGDADDLVAGDVADVRCAVERQRVMLAEAHKGDRSSMIWLATDPALPWCSVGNAVKSLASPS